MTTYTVTAERGRIPQMWVFQCAEFPGAVSQSRRLADAPLLMREAIAFVSGEPAEDIEVAVVPVLPDEMAAQVREARAAVARLADQQRETADLSRSAARSLVGAGMTRADAAVVLGVSPQRVSQLILDRAP